MHFVESKLTAQNALFLKNVVHCTIATRAKSFLIFHHLQRISAFTFFFHIAIFSLIHYVTMRISFSYKNHYVAMNENVETTISCLFLLSTWSL